MRSNEIAFRPHHQTVVDRFVLACRSDDRVAAAFLSGSYARGAADEFSDLDLNLVATDAGFPDVICHREDFVRWLGEPVFIEDFGNPHTTLYILSNGTEGELAFGREGDFEQIAHGDFKVLVDKEGILSGAVLAGDPVDPAGQTEDLSRLIAWFWHDFSHFATALGRGKLWWAHGQLEEIRRICVGLARLRHNFSDLDAAGEAYFKVEESMPVEQLEGLRSTVCSLDQKEMLEAGFAVLAFYRETATALGIAHGLEYPHALDRIMTGRLESLRRSR
jgi:hypothetical protein